MDRIEKLCAYLDKCDFFADVGCDHGYCTEYMLKRGLCSRAQISDISAKSLEKAEKLLKDYIADGRVIPTVCDGLEKIDPSADEVLIAGMGGDNIVGILSAGFIPEKFVLQPMHGARGVRSFLIERGAKITADEPFFCGGKFYFVIKGERAGGTSYGEANFEYGLSLGGECTREFIKTQITKMRGYLESDMAEAARAEIENKIKFAEGVLNGEIR